MGIFLFPQLFGRVKSSSLKLLYINIPPRYGYEIIKGTAESSTTNKPQINGTYERAFKISNLGFIVIISKQGPGRKKYECS